MEESKTIHDDVQVTEDQVQAITGVPEGEIFIPEDREYNISGEETEPCNPAEFREYREAMLKVTKEYAVCMVGSDCLVLHEYYDPVEKRYDIRFMSFDSFNKRMLNRKTVNPWRKPSAKKYRSVGPMWLASNYRRDYDQIMFDPSNTIDRNKYYNMFRGFGVKPKQGNWSYLRSHIKDIVCAGDEKLDHYVMSWMARIVQDPGGNRPGTALVFRGIQGCGKGVVVRALGTICGAHFRHILHLVHLTGKFNVHLKDALLIFCDEITWGGDKNTEGVLKGLITEPKIRIEPKSKDSQEINSHLNVCVASNNDWVIPAGLEERRFCVLDVLPDKANDKEYFAQIYRQLEDGGYEAMMYDLSHYERLSVKQLRTIPRTRGLLDQIISSMSPVHKFWYQCLINEGIPGEDFWPRQIECEKLYNRYIEFCETISKRGYNIINNQFSRKLREICPALTTSRISIPGETGISKRTYIYNIPGLAECRFFFEDSVRLSIEWDEMDENLISDN